MPDIQYFQGGYEEEKHDKVLFGLLGGHDEIHIHFNAAGGAPAKDVWEQNNQVLGGLLAHSHDLHMHQDASATSGPTDIKMHDGSILGGLIIDDHKSDFQTQRMTQAGMETRESHESSGSSLGGIIAEGSNRTDTTSLQGADGVTRTETRHDSEGSVLGGIIAGGQDHSEMSQVTTPDGKTLTTHFKDDNNGEVIGGLAAQGQEHTEFVDNGQGRIGIHTAEASVLGGIVYSGDSGKVYGADLPGAENYINCPSPFRAITGAPSPTPDVSESSYNGPAIAAGADANQPAVAPAGEVNQPPARMTVPMSPDANAEVPAPRAATSQGGNLSADAPMGAAHPQVVRNFIDPETKQPIDQANVLRFDNSDYFLADGRNVRLYDSHNQQVKFVQEGPTAVAQSAGVDDMVPDPETNKMVPRLQAKISADGKGVEFDFAGGLTVKADKNGDYVTGHAGPSDTSDLEAAPIPVPPAAVPANTPG